jgi:hypothetical protein
MAISQELRVRLVECVRVYRVERGETIDWATTFQEIEDEACALGDAVAQALMAESLAEQALQEPRRLSVCCPRCRRPAPAEPEPASRRLDTRRGPVGWDEPQYYCRRCRQSFFPSVARVGD